MSLGQRKHAVELCVQREARHVWVYDLIAKPTEIAKTGVAHTTRYSRLDRWHSA